MWGKLFHSAEEKWSTHCGRHEGDMSGPRNGGPPVVRIYWGNEAPKTIAMLISCSCSHKVCQNLLSLLTALFSHGLREMDFSSGRATVPD